MTRTVAIECAGHPREMGEDQGRSVGAEVRALLQRVGPFAGRRSLPARAASLVSSRLPSLCPYASGRVRGGGAGRELIRHFTHMSERIDGLARAAGRPVDDVPALQLRAARGDPACAPAPGELCMALGFDGAGSARLEAVLPACVSGSDAWVLRRSRPEVGFRSLELTLPWLVSGLAGVNESGLCAGIVCAAGDEGACGAAAPAILLVQECLQRFEQIEGALDWCLERPTCGNATILLGDSRGQLAAVRVESEERRALPVRQGLLIVGGDVVEVEARAEIRGEGGSREESDIAAALDRFRAARKGDSTRIRCDTSSCRLALSSAKGERSELALS